MFKTIFNRLIARQVAQHGSVAAVVLGLVCNLLGIPLASEQISLLITAGSVVVYLFSQARSLWHPPSSAPTVAKVLLVLLGALAFAPHARAEVHTVTLTPPTQKTDNSPLDLANLRTWRLQCGLGASSTTVAGWIFNDEVSFPTTHKDYDFKPNGQWNCHAWVTTNYSCASMQVADGAWTFGTGGDVYGNSVLVNGNDATGTALRLVNINGVTFAESGSGLTPDDATKHTWWSWGGPNQQWWTGPIKPAPTIPAGAPQLTPITPPLCMSADTADLVFTIPMNSPQKTSNANPGVPGITLSTSGAITH